MRVCLVAPISVESLVSPTVSAVEAQRLIGEHPPLGVLSLAAVLEAAGTNCQVIDLNREACPWNWHVDSPSDGFALHAATMLAELDCDVYGFGSLCGSYPLTLRILRQLKRLRPGRPLLLGGPQASVTDVATMNEFPEIDITVRGEAEHSLPRLIEELGGRGNFEAIPGITFRLIGSPVRNCNGRPIENLDELPFPAYHWHPEVKYARWASLELGRGCPFACKFCSTNDFFRRKYRLKSPSAVVRQMDRMFELYGTHEFDLIHDMFTIDRKRVVEFCEVLKSAGSPYRWFCSARTDCVDDELLQLMADAGCASVFFGIETGSARMQRVIDKNLDMEKAARAVGMASRKKVHVAVSLILGYPEERREDLRDTVTFLAGALHHDLVHPLLYLLVPLAATPVHQEYRDQLRFDPIRTLTCDQGWHQDSADRALIAALPDVFPNFYELPLQRDRARLHELKFFLRTIVSRFKWLLIALQKDSGDALAVFEQMRGWIGRRGQPTASSEETLEDYFQSDDMLRDLLDFLVLEY